MKPTDPKTIDSIVLKLASPEAIEKWSYGEVTKPETINYRTGRAERNGLFDERIFGPEKDYECYCGKYRRVRYKGIVCEKCGVEITRSVVRRERMGHIELAAPVAHIWFLRGIPSRISLLLNLTVADLEKVVYFSGYIITKVDQEEKDSILSNIEQEFKTKLKSLKTEEDREKLKTLMSNVKQEVNEIVEGKVLNESEYHHYSLKYGTAFEAGIGAEAIYNIFKQLDLEKMKEKIEESIESAGSTEKPKLHKRLNVVKSLLNANLRPEWMFLTRIPVIPPALRPMVALDGGRHATSDVNDLYRRVINRNSRLKKLKDLGAPEVILRNEKRILQEAVDSLIDNSIKKQSDSVAMSQSQRRALKSLSENLKGKQGLLRQNLLGKRVDYSGRSVIVVGPQLKIDQCGLPKHMALELFRPFVISKILEKELAFNIRSAGRLIEEQTPEVWAILEKVIVDKYVLLNRAPTLHRLGIQGFRPVLIEGNAIQVHPLVCTAFNADFDGDQMAVHVPLSDEAQQEARELMSADKNILRPGSGDPIVNPTLDVALGCFWMTKIIDGEKGEGKIFPNPNSAITAYDFGQVSFRAKIKVMGTDSERYSGFNGEVFETSIGRLLFNSVLPSDFPYLNEEVDKKKLAKIVDSLVAKYGLERVPEVLDDIKKFGFHYSTIAGITWGIDEVIVPGEKEKIVADAQKKELEVISQYENGLLSDDEKYRQKIEIWENVKQEIEDLIPGQLDVRGSVYDLLYSGARGSISQLVQMSGIKGLTQNTQGQIIDFPIVPSYKEGLSPIEYFITTHGARKGLADTALKTAKAGYLTRRLVDVSQDAIISEEDCGTKEGMTVRAENISGIDIPLSRNVYGCILASDVVDSSGKVIFSKGHLVGREDSMVIENSGVESVEVRSPSNCKSLHGICQKCYGLDMGRNKLVDLGEAVGIVAAQAIGEPGTQLTMRTFHAGGVAGVDITMGLPRIEEVFERRLPKAQATVCQKDGEVLEIKTEEKDTFISVLEDSSGNKKSNEKEYKLSPNRVPAVKAGDRVEKGQLLTDGSADILEVFKYGGKQKTQQYIVSEINKVYELQGASISRKHIEVVIKQMFSRRKIKESGDTLFTPGEIVEIWDLEETNKRMREAGKEEATGEIVVLGISEVSLTAKSWLSAASFQNTTRVLINNAIKGGVDDLRGLKENVIIGNLIPAGTGFRQSGISEETEEESRE